MWISPAFAEAAKPASGAGGADMLSTFLPLILIFVVFWFLLIRPQQKRAKEQREMQSNLSKGDEVLTFSGMIGKITKIVDNNPELEIEIADGVRIRTLRGAIQGKYNKDALQPKSAAAASNDNKDSEKKAGPLARLFGKR
jgi:preprotein translocase subunit YajC